MLSENSLKIKNFIKCAVIYEPFVGVGKALKRATRLYSQLGYSDDILSESRLETERYFANREGYLK